MKKYNPQSVPSIVNVYDKGDSSRIIAKKYDVSHTTILRWLRQNDFQPRSKSEAAKNGIRQGRISIFSHPLPETCKIMGIDKSYVIGVLCGDGCVHVNEGRRCYQVGLSATDFEFVLEFGKSIMNVYGICPSMRIIRSANPRWKDKWSSRVFSKRVCMDIMDLGSDFKSWNWIIPECVQDAPNCIKESFLRDLFDSDGDIDTATRRINLTTTNLQGAIQTKSLLESLEIRSKIRNHKVRGNRSKRFDLRIQDKRSIDRYSRLIGFNILRKKHRLDKLVGKFRN